MTLGPWASGLPEVNAGSQLETGCGNTEKAGVRPGSWVSSGPWRMVGVGPGPELGLKLLALALRGKEQRPRARRRSRARGWTARPRGTPQLLDVGCWGGRRLRGGGGQNVSPRSSGVLGSQSLQANRGQGGALPQEGSTPTSVGATQTPLTEPRLTWIKRRCAEPRGPSTGAASGALGHSLPRGGAGPPAGPSGGSPGLPAGSNQCWFC